MKALIAIFGFLTLAHCMVKVPTAPKTVVVDKEAILEELNKDRREYAKKWKITNMYKLVWDDDLATKAKNRDFSGNKHSYRKAHIDGNQDVNDIIKSIREQYSKDGKLDVLINDYKTYHIYGMEQLIPHQKKIGCTPDFQYKKNNGHIMKTHTLCFLGPEGAGESWNYERGEPGSKCIEGYNNEDGLCAAPVEKTSARLILTTEQPNTESNGNAYNTRFLAFSITFLIFVVM